jgi:hypothetical protein
LLSGCQIQAHFSRNSRDFNSDTTCIGPIANPNPPGERSPKTAPSTYRSCHNIIITQILNRSSRCAVEIPCVWWYNRPHCKGLGIQVVKSVSEVVLLQTLLISVCGVFSTGSTCIFALQSQCVLQWSFC